MKPLFIVTTGGGLGNQIISYALWLYLKKLGYHTHLYLRKNSLANTFEIENDFSRKTYAMNFLLYVVKKIERLKRFVKETDKQYSSFGGLNVIDYPEWPDYKFIGEILPELKQKLVFIKESNNKNLFLVKEMLQSNSVSIHVRRGDYQNSIYWRIILGDICDKQYYTDAINKVKEILPNPKFFVFSDDIQWVKSNLHMTDVVYIDWNVGEHSFRDMELMSYCKANIIANSTFSLCAAWLNRNENPIRIVPSKWLNKFHDNLLEKYIPSDWIVIDNKKPTISILLNGSVPITHLRNILKQKYTDFEIVTHDIPYEKIDERVVWNEVRGRYIYNYSFENYANFRHDAYLYNWLRNMYNKENFLDNDKN